MQKKKFICFIIDLFIRMTIILKKNTFVRDSSPNPIGNPLSRRLSLSEHNPVRSTGKKNVNIDKLILS
jgi:hypothetical protein